MRKNTDEHPGSGLDKAPDKSLTEKLTDTVKAIIKPFPRPGKLLATSARRRTGRENDA
jgi:hypothetical protein